MTAVALTAVTALAVPHIGLPVRFGHAALEIARVFEIIVGVGVNPAVGQKAVGVGLNDFNLDGCHESISPPFKGTRNNPTII
jgi:hypothetical protein